MAPQAMSHVDRRQDRTAAEPDARQLAKDLAPYRRSSRVRSLIELAVTLGPFTLLWLLMWAALDVGYWLTLLLAVPAAGFMLRIFMIQHDCGHGAFFRRRRANDWVGRLLSVLTLTPYDYWKRDHAVHHATSGNLDRRGVGDIDTLTVREFLAMSWWRRLGYRLYRHPIVMFGIGPAFIFILQFRLPVRAMRDGWGPWMSTMATNAGIGLFLVLMIWAVGWQSFLAVHLPIIVLAASAGVWLFYIQHQFEDTSWASEQDWNVHDFALHGSSYYELPAALRWLTANIGMHHIHHLCSRIPFYRLPEVMRDHPHLASVGKVTLLESFKCVRLVLWDETRRRLISFSDLRDRASLLRTA